MSSHAKVRSTRIRNAWITALNKRFLPRLVVLRLRGFSLMFGISPALKMHFPIACGIKAAIQIEIGPSEIQPDLFRHLF